MRRIYHLVSLPVWQRCGDGPYQADSLAAEGFIHCSNNEQVVRIANLFFAGVPEVLALTIDANRLTSPVRVEDSGTGELFPHVYGPIDRAAIIEAIPLQRGPDGRWQWHS